MYRVLIVGSEPIRVRIDTEGQYFEIQYSDVFGPIRFTYDDPYDIIKVIEQYTSLSQEDIQRILGVCYYGW